MNTKIVVSIVGALLLASVGVAKAQQPGKVYRIGVLSPLSGIVPRDEVFKQRLRELGYNDGQNVMIEWRFWDGKPDRLNDYAAELVDLKVAVIFGTNSQTIQAAKKATTTIPVVMSVSSDPAESGLVASLERPGGNITGLAYVSPALNSKRFELLKEIVPQLSRVGVLLDPDYPTLAAAWKETLSAADLLGLKLQAPEVRSANDFEPRLPPQPKESASAHSLQSHGHRKRA